MNAKNQMKRTDTPGKMAFPASIQKPNALFKDQFENTFVSQNENQRLFTFNPIKSMQFLEDNFLLSRELKNDSHNSQSKNETKDTLSRLLNSTTVSESIKKSLNASDKTAQPPNSGVLSKTNTANFNNNPDVKQIKQITLKPTHDSQNQSARIENRYRTCSLNFHNVDNFFNNCHNPTNGANVDKINKLKKANNCGKKVLNVGLSKNYIMAYKNKDPNLNELGDKLKMSFAQKMKAKPVEDKDQLKTEQSNRCSISPSKNNLFVQTVTSHLTDSSKNETGKTSDLKRYLPQTLTDFFDRRYEKSLPKRMKSKPKVFDFCKLIETTSHRYPATLKTPNIQIEPLQMKRALTKVIGDTFDSQFRKRTIE